MTSCGANQSAPGLLLPFVTNLTLHSHNYTDHTLIARSLIPTTWHWNRTSLLWRRTSFYTWGTTSCYTILFVCIALTFRETVWRTYKGIGVISKLKSIASVMRLTQISVKWINWRMHETYPEAIVSAVKKSTFWYKIPQLSRLNLCKLGVCTHSKSTRLCMR